MGNRSFDISGDAIVTIAQQWLAARNEFVRRNKVSASGAGPTVNHMEFMRTHEEFGARMLEILPPMTPEVFEAFREVTGVIPHILAQRGKAFRTDT